VSTLNPLRIAVGARQLNALLAFTAGLGLLWCAVLPLKYAMLEPGQQATAGGESFLIALAAALAAWLGQLLGLSLATGARVLDQHRVPTRFWRQWLFASLQQTLLLWAVLAACAATALLPQQSPWHGLTGAAVVSLVLSLSALRVLAVQGLMPRYWAWAGPLALLYPLVGADGVMGFLQALQQLDSMPWPVVLGIAASWPVVVFWLFREWSQQIPHARQRGSTASVGLWRRMKPFFARYTPLTGWVEWSHRKPHGAMASSVLARTLWLPFSLLNPTLFAQDWGSGVPVWKVWVFGLFTMVVSGNLACKNLHWRMVLAPARGLGSALGWRIVVSTAAVYGAVVLFAVFLVAAGAWLFLPIPLGKLIAYLPAFVVTPLQLVFAISLGTLIRGANVPRIWRWAVIAMWLFCGVVVFALGRASGDSHIYFKIVCFKVDYAYVLSLLLLSALSIWLANRLWTVEKLLRSAAR
jgi:hypothetical protein